MMIQSSRGNLNNEIILVLYLFCKNCDITDYENFNMTFNLIKLRAKSFVQP